MGRQKNTQLNNLQIRYETELKQVNDSLKSELSLEALEARNRAISNVKLNEKKIQEMKRKRREGGHRGLSEYTLPQSVSRHSY